MCFFLKLGCMLELYLMLPMLMQSWASSWWATIAALRLRSHFPLTTRIKLGIYWNWYLCLPISLVLTAHLDSTWSLWWEDAVSMPQYRSYGRRKHDSPSKERYILLSNTTCAYLTLQKHLLSSLILLWRSMLRKIPATRRTFSCWHCVSRSLLISAVMYL